MQPINASILMFINLRTARANALVTAFLLLCSLEPYLKGAAVDAPKPTAHELKNVEGWTVHVDQRLVNGSGAELGERSLRILGNQLFEISLVMAPDRLEKVRRVHIWLDLSHGELKIPQYHPSADWLKEHGYTTELAKCVHIPDAAVFSSPRDHMRQPWAILHELAHAYHDQVLGFADAEIKTAWKNFAANRRYQSVLQIDGRIEKHYALTDEKEFFAEMSETYFGENDFFPFNRAELRQEEPEIFKLLDRIWGPIPSPIARESKRS